MLSFKKEPLAYLPHAARLRELATPALDAPGNSALSLASAWHASLSSFRAISVLATPSSATGAVGERGAWLYAW